MSEMSEERPRGILTEADREYLRGERDLSEGSEFNTRRRIRERIYHSFLDFPILFKHMQEVDIQRVFLTDSQEEENALREGLIHAIAFIYYGSFGFQPSFSWLLESGVRIAEDKLAKPGTRDVTVTFDVESVQRVFTEETIDEIVSKIQYGKYRQLTPDEREAFIRFLVRSDEFDPEMARDAFYELVNDVQKEHSEGGTYQAERKRELQRKHAEHIDKMGEKGGYDIESRVRKYAEKQGISALEAEEELLSAGLEAIESDDT